MTGRNAGSASYPQQSTNGQAETELYKSFWDLNISDFIS